MGHCCSNGLQFKKCLGGKHRIPETSLFFYIKIHRSKHANRIAIILVNLTADIAAWHPP